MNQVVVAVLYFVMVVEEKGGASNDFLGISPPSSFAGDLLKLSSSGYLKSALKRMK